MTGYAGLAGFAYNTAQQFAVSANFVACLAWRFQTPVVEADLLICEFSPSMFNVERALGVLRRCAHTLSTRLNTRELGPAALARATLRVEFFLGEYDGTHRRGEAPIQLGSLIWVELVDDRGRLHEGRLSATVLVQC